MVALIVWMATGDIRVARDQAPPEPAEEGQGLTRVEVQALQAQDYQPTLKLQGQLQPWQTVEVSARASGTVEQLVVELGQRVSKGQPLLRLSTDGRNTVVERWQAAIRKLDADLAAARQLKTRNLAAENEVLGLQSELAAARAERTAAQLTVQHLQPRAPFDALVNGRMVDEGALVQVGTPLFELVQINRLKATGQVPQQRVHNVEPGQPVSVVLLDGTRLTGKVSFVASAADPATRSFALEVEVENPELKRVAGGSANLNVQLPQQTAIFISPAYLSLDDSGRPGVKYVNAENRVEFRTVRLLSVSDQGAWVAGLPARVRLITRGAGFVTSGEQVEPVERSGQRD